MATIDEIKADLDAITATAVTRVQKAAIALAAEQLLAPLLQDPYLFTTGAANAASAAPAIAAGKPIAALGAAASAAAVGSPTIADIPAALAFLASGLGVNVGDLTNFIAVIKASPAPDRDAVLNTAIQGARGMLVEASRLSSANADLQDERTKVATIARITGVDLDVGTWERDLRTHESTRTAAPTGGLTAADKTNFLAFFAELEPALAKMVTVRDRGTLGQVMEEKGVTSATYTAAKAGLPRLL